MAIGTGWADSAWVDAGWVSDAWSDALVTVPTIPGLEYTMTTNRHHYGLLGNDVQFTLTDNKHQYTMDDD